MNTINFTRNWNNKLNCNFFTTIRRPNIFYKEGEIFYITMPGKEKNSSGIPLKEILFTAEIVHVKELLLGQILPSECLFDMGYDRSDSIEILKKIYNLSEKYWRTERFAILYLKRCKPIKCQPVVNTHS